MTTTLTITGPVFTNTIQPAFPTITNLRTLAFFGTAGDGNNANRVVGGPAIAVQSGAPVYGTNQVPLGAQPYPSPTRNDVLNTQNPRDAPTLAGGCTWVAVVRISQVPVGNAARGNILGDQNGTGISSSWGMAVTGQGVAQLEIGNTPRASITQLISPITSWHFYAMSYTGGAAGTFTGYDFTENATTGVPVTYVTSGQVVGAQSPHFGALSTETLITYPSEYAFGCVANSVMSVPTLAQLYAWAKANLARRSITI